MGCSFLATVDRRRLDPLLEAMGRIDTLLLQFGASRYAGDYLRFSPDRWRTHLGPNWEEFQRLKRRHDPAGILNRHIMA